MSGIINQVGARSGIISGGSTAQAGTVTLSGTTGLTYEEGTWTPGFGGGSGTLVASVANATYIRIGNQVHIAANLGVSSTSSPTGDLIINGLPFSNPADHHSCGSIYIRNLSVNTNLESGSYFSMLIVGGDIYVRVGGRDGADGASTYGSGKIVRQYLSTTDVTCWFQMTYQTS